MNTSKQPAPGKIPVKRLDGRKVKVRLLEKVDGLGYRIEEKK